MHQENADLSTVDPAAEPLVRVRPQPKTISLYHQDLQRLAALRQALSIRCERPISASELMRLALYRLDREWQSRHSRSGGDDAA